MVSYIVPWLTLFDSDPCSNSSTCPHRYYCEPSITTTTSTNTPSPSGFCMHGKFYDPINGYKYITLK